MGEWARMLLPRAAPRSPANSSFVAAQTGTGRCQQNCGRTTKPTPLAPAIALPPAGSAFFSLVFFAEAKKSDRRPPQGDVVFRWVQQPTPLKQTATNPASKMSYGRYPYRNRKGSNKAPSYSPRSILPNSIIRNKMS